MNMEDKYAKHVATWFCPSSDVADNLLYLRQHKTLVAGYHLVCVRALCAAAHMLLA